MTKAEKERLAKVGKTFNAKKYIKNEIEEIRRQVGDKKVLLAMSGGVDSSVCAVLLQKAIGKQLTCVFVDHGCMRLNEAKEIKKIFKGKFGINLIQIDAEARFLEKAKGVTDPEMKRKIIGGEFIRVFEEEAKKLGKIEFLGQGTIYPDIVESGVGGIRPLRLTTMSVAFRKIWALKVLSSPSSIFIRTRFARSARSLAFLSRW